MIHKTSFRSLKSKMKPDLMSYSHIQFTYAIASHTRLGIILENEYDAYNVISKSDKTSWNSGTFAPVSLTLGWDIHQHCITGLWLSPDMLPQTGMVEVKISLNDDEILFIHKAKWTCGQIYSIFFPKKVHNVSTIKITFTQSPSWIALFWIKAWQYNGECTVLKTPVSLFANPVKLRKRMVRTPNVTSNKYFN